MALMVRISRLLSLRWRWREGWPFRGGRSLLIIAVGYWDSGFMVSAALLPHMLVVLNHNFHELRVVSLCIVILFRCWTRTSSLSINYQGVVVVGFDCDVIYDGSRDVAVEVIIVSILFEIETWDEAVYESMTT
jgi:hypothetical protein